jgi:hypothetical protein
MEPIIINLPRGKYISEIQPFISNTIDLNGIWHKTVTGCGISRWAIEKYQGNMIIIFPNVPVIMDKAALQNKEHPDSKVLPVYQGVDVVDIKNYLLGDSTYKKILTTPEGFVSKVLKAFKEIDELYDNFFLLFDECDRIITDVSYRGQIAAPLNQFFNFKNKGLVSATPIAFSDERFKDFQHYILEPDYDYSKKLDLVATNNVIASFKKVIEKLTGERLCIFINSTSGIAAIQKSLGIVNQSMAFCARESVTKLRVKEVKAESYFEASAMKKYNFFTSRYFSAFDMELEDCKPDVVIISDVIFADHSMIDPHTEAIQIAGRLRKGINSLTHITNFSPQMKVKAKDELLSYLEGCFHTYEGFVKSHSKATNPGSKDMFEVAIKESPVNSFYIGGKRNSFMIDNALYEERVKSYYLSQEHLESAYAEVPKHFVVTIHEDMFGVGDGDLFTLRSKQTKREKLRTVAALLHRDRSMFQIGSLDEINSLPRLYPELAEAYRLIGLNGLETTDYDMTRIKLTVAKAKVIRERKRVAPYVQAQFSNPGWYSEAEILSVIESLYQLYHCKQKPTVAQIKQYFIARRSTQQGVNGYVLVSPIDMNSIQDY